MRRTVKYLENRARKLENRDPVINRNIINKLRRQIRALESK